MLAYISSRKTIETNLGFVDQPAVYLKFAKKNNCNIENGDTKAQN